MTNLGIEHSTFLLSQKTRPGGGENHHQARKNATIVFVLAGIPASPGS